MEASRALIEGGADVNLPCSEGATALHAASSGDQGEIVELLIKAGARLEALDQSRLTPLHYSSRVLAM